VTGRWFSLGFPVSSTNKNDSHDITEIVLKVALNTIKQTNKTCPEGPSFSGIQNSDSDFQDSESGSYFPLFLSRGYLYHVTITYRLAAGCDRSVVFPGFSGFIHQ
jgi:hypothetical protein